jgi:hypothetical protein
VASPGRDTCQAEMDVWTYGSANTEVTHVTTHRVTRGKLMSSSDVAADRAYGRADAAVMTGQYGR